MSFSYRFATELSRALCDLIPSMDCCWLCDQPVKVSDMLIHMQIIHGQLVQFSSVKIMNEAPKIKCDECPKTFLCFFSLQRHMLMDHDTAMRGVCRSHLSGLNIMLCGYCGQYDGNIIDHLVEEHGKQIVLSFKQTACPVCNDMFEQKNQTFEEHLTSGCCKWAEPSDEEK